MSTDMEEVQELTWEQIRAGLKAFAKHSDTWAGCPLPLDGIKLVIEPRYPHQGLHGYAFDEERDPDYDAYNDQQYGGKPLAKFVRYSPHKEGYLGIELVDGKQRIAWRLSSTKVDQQLRMMMDTMIAIRAWDIEAELKAQVKLGSLIDDHQMRQYMLTGSFVERSKRSQVLYVFRRLRPTLALRHGWDYHLKVLCGLCFHPVGYYEKTFAGCLVPTDDVIAHLLMMRGDERKFWAQANQHTAESMLGF